MRTLILYAFDELPSEDSKLHAVASEQERIRPGLDEMVSEYIADYLWDRGYSFDSMEYFDDAVEFRWEIPKGSPLRQGIDLIDIVIKPTIQGHKVECLLDGEPVPFQSAHADTLRQIKDNINRIAADLHADIKPQIDHLYGYGYAIQNIRAEKNLFFFEDGSPVMIPESISVSSCLSAPGERQSSTDTSPPAPCSP